jgi:hypothetical protein
MNLWGVLFFHGNIATTVSVYLLNTHLLNLSNLLVLFISHKINIHFIFFPFIFITIEQIQ